MEALLIITHGSPLKKANEAFRFLCGQLRKKLPHLIVQEAFLSCDHPLFEFALDDLAKLKIKKITVLPYFLSAGKHTQKDIPEIIKNKSKLYPWICFELKPHLGSAEKMMDWILSFCSDSSPVLSLIPKDP